MSENIKVAVRVRPFLPNEVPLGCVRTTANQVVVGDGRCFAFDTVFDMSASSDDVYVALGQPLANAFLDGFNVSTIAYGQTGAGKTFTMAALSNDVVQEVFCRLQEEAAQAEEKQLADLGFTMRMSALEVYNEHVGDLLHNKASTLKHVAGVSPVPQPHHNGTGSSGTPSPANGSPNPSGSGGGGNARQYRQSMASGTMNSNFPSGGGGGSGGGATGPALALREDPKGGVYVAGLSEYDVKTEEALLACIENATANRKTATTLMNATSSRSHCVVTLTLQRKGVVSRCCFVDLAGSERFKKSLGVGMDPSVSSSLLGSTNPMDATLVADGTGNVVMDRMREGISINGGLLALGNVIVALCEKKSHVPYRSSKLTRLLQPMLGGNSKTAMVACISPLESSIEETLNTLKYANRAKSIKTSPHLVAAVSSMLMSPEEAERVILALRKELEDVQLQLAQALSQGNANMRSNSRGGPRRFSRTASAVCQPSHRSASVIGAAEHGGGGSGGNGGNGNGNGNGQTRGRKRTNSRQPLPRGGGGGDARTEELSSAAMLKQISELKLQLSQERAVAKRLEEDLFNAEYTTMIEVEKRRAAEERVLELESMLTPTDNASISSCAHSTGSATDSPRTRLTQNMALLRKLEEERDSLQKLKAQKEEVKQRLSHALSGNDTSASGPPSATNTSFFASDAALAELSADIEAKNEQVAALERQNDTIMQQLHQYEMVLEAITTEKTQLQEELAKAEELLEKSEVDRQQKDADRAKLQAEYRERLRKAEDRAADYRRRVKRAEQDMRMRSLNLQRIDLLKHEVEKLREEAARQKAVRRAEQKKGIQLSATHSQEVAALQKQLREAEQQVARLQGGLQRREREIERIKARVHEGTPPPTAAVAAPSARGRTAPHPVAADGVIYKQRPASLVPVVDSGPVSPTAAHSTAADSVSIQAQIDDEVSKLEKLEKELQELQDCRRVLAQTQSTDAPKYQSALKGFAKRLQHIDHQLDVAGKQQGGGSSIHLAEQNRSASAPPSDAERTKLLAEREDIKIKLRQLETFQKMFDEAKQQLEEFDDRIDSLNETRKYHLHRVLRLQHARTSTATSGIGGSTSSAGAAGGANGANSLPSSSASLGPSTASAATVAWADSTGPPLSSVREITTARMRNSVGPGASGRCAPKHRDPQDDFFAAAHPSSTGDATGAGGPTALESKAHLSQQRYILQLEKMVELLKKESAGLRAQLTQVDS